MLGFRFDASDPYNHTTVHALKSGLRSNLPVVKLGLEKTLKTAFEGEIGGKKDSDGLPTDCLACFISIADIHRLD